MRSAAVSRAAALRHPRKHPAWACRPQSLWLETPWSVLGGGGPAPHKGHCRRTPRARFHGMKVLCFIGETFSGWTPMCGETHSSPTPAPKLKFPFVKSPGGAAVPGPGDLPPSSSPRPPSDSIILPLHSFLLLQGDLPDQPGRGEPTSGSPRVASFAIPCVPVSCRLGHGQVGGRAPCTPTGWSPTVGRAVAPSPPPGAPHPSLAVATSSVLGILLTVW